MANHQIRTYRLESKIAHYTIAVSRAMGPNQLVRYVGLTMVDGKKEIVNGVIQTEPLRACHRNGGRKAIVWMSDGANRLKVPI